MARKKFNLGVSTDAPTSASKKKRDLFENPLEQTQSGRKKASRITGRKTDAAGRVRKTIFLEPTSINEIEDLASQHGYSKMDFYEWLILMGLDQFLDGIRPEIEARSVVRNRIKIER